MLSNVYHKDRFTERIREQIPRDVSKNSKAPKKIASHSSPELIEEEIIKLREKEVQVIAK